MITPATSWADGPLLAFDLETTGVDVDADRIVTASVIVIEPGARPQVTNWLADPGIPIPAEAAAVHGISTERARAEGAPAAEVVAEVHAALRAHWSATRPAICFNGSFDLSLLDRELHRHTGGGLELPGPVVDPLVIDRHVDRYRPGSRRLEAMCAHYGLVHEQAHAAHADALSAARLAWKLARHYPAEVGGLALAELHTRQAGWHRRWALEFADYLDRRGNAERAAEVRASAAGWPVRERAGVPG